MNDLLQHKLVKAAAHLLNQPIENASNLAQGDLSHVMLIAMEEGEKYVIKNGPFPKTEAEMLNLLLAHDIDVPKVIAADNQVLILKFIRETNRLSKNTWANLGKLINKLHQIHNSYYGWDKDYAFGKVKIINQKSENWAEFWGKNRIEYFIRKLPSTLASQLEALLKDLHNRLPLHPPASLLHGDLWTGNVMIHIDRPYLIDPACYYGHSEVDIAMLNVFALPPTDFYSTYGELEPSWQERMPIYQLFPALVHYTLFGNSYLPMVSGLVSKLKL